MTSLTIHCTPHRSGTAIGKTLLSPTSPLKRYGLSRRPREASIRPPKALPAPLVHEIESTKGIISDIDASLPEPDQLVLRSLLRDIDEHESGIRSSGQKESASSDDEQTLRKLKALFKYPAGQNQPRAYASWPNSEFSPWINSYLLEPYTAWARTVVRHPGDVPYLTAMLTFLAFGVPNLISMFWSFNWYQGLFQWAWVIYHVPTYTLLMHWQHHSRVLSHEWRFVDRLFPYIFNPMMGLTWNTFHYHHKQHHIEDNGPDDVSSTLRYQRDSALDFCKYVSRFLLFCWLELPMYYVRKNKPVMGLKAFAWEVTSYIFLFTMASLNFRAALMGLLLPVLQWRIAIMASNWGHHAFIDEVEPSAPIRCSTTCVDALNDGYHTMHHLNPARHWSEHPYAFVRAKKELAEGQTLTFRNIDSIKLTFFMLRKDYAHIASCLIPMGDQIGRTKEELGAMLRRKANKFSEEEIQLKFGSETT